METRLNDLCLDYEVIFFKIVSARLRIKITRSSPQGQSFVRSEIPLIKPQPSFHNSVLTFCTVLLFHSNSRSCLEVETRSCT